MLLKRDTRVATGESSLKGKRLTTTTDVQVEPEHRDVKHLYKPADVLDFNQITEKIIRRLIGCETRN